MGASYQSIGFNRHKWRYDVFAMVGIILFLALFIGAGSVLYPSAAPETFLIRGFSTAAFGLLHIILSIGPLARLNPRFLPLLYNRRHLGVLVSLIASAHALISIIQFHAFGDLHPLTSVLISDGSFERLGSLPFQPFGLLAWIIILLMAVTSHDFWLRQLSAPTWKRLHMLVYVAWAALVAHVLLGIGSDAVSSAPIWLTLAGSAWLITIHVAAAFRSAPGPDKQLLDDPLEVDAGTALDIPDQRAIAVQVVGETVAVFRDGHRVFALSGVCQHQNGPLAEGKLVDGKVVCPWHGYEYCPLKGTSPPPFDEWVPTFDVRISEGQVLVSASPNPRGTESTAGPIEDAS